MTSSKDLQPLTTSVGGLFIKSQLFTKPKPIPKTTDLSGQIACITGANIGLGLESARQLLLFKLSHLIIAVRSVEKGEAAAAQLRSRFPASVIEVCHLEMSSYASIQTFVDRLSQLPRLDIVILNAAVGKFSFNIIPETGHEEGFQVNYLSTMLLTILILPVLKRKSPANTPGRLTIVNSGAAYYAKFLNRDASPLLPSFTHPKIDFGEQYQCAKLVGQMFIYRLVDYVSADDVIVNMVDPGFVRDTGLARDATGMLSAAMRVLKMMARNVQDGASTYLDAAIVKGKESHGSFVSDWEIRP